jgi:hypothetical protein
MEINSQDWALPFMVPAIEHPCHRLTISWVDCVPNSQRLRLSPVAG